MQIQATDLTDFHKIANYASNGKSAQIEGVRVDGPIVVVVVRNPRDGQQSTVVYLADEMVEVA